MKTVKDVVAAYPDGNELPFKNGQEVFIAQINTLAGVVEKRYYVKQYWCHSGHQSEYVTLGIIFDNKIDAENKCRELLGLPKRMIAGTTSVNEQWYDYDKQQAISLPPVGVECEVIYQLDDSPKWECGMVIGKSNYNKDLVFEFKSGGVSFVTSDSEFRPLDWNKNKEREEFIDKRKHDVYLDAINKSELISMPQSTGEDLASLVLGYMYDKGARFND